MCSNLTVTHGCTIHLGTHQGSLHMLLDDQSGARRYGQRVVGDPEHPQGCSLPTDTPSGRCSEIIGGPMDGRLVAYMYCIARGIPSHSHSFLGHSVPTELPQCATQLSAIDRFVSTSISIWRAIKSIDNQQAETGRRLMICCRPRS